MKAVDIVIVNELIPIYKNGEEANAIQVARIKDREGNSCQFNIIVGKGLYNIGDNVIYIQPDYCLPDTELFKEYIKPGNDPSKCRLGRKGRIRALKFNFTFKDDVNPIYSNGIIIPSSECAEVVSKALVDNEYDLQTELKVIKYVAEDSFDSQRSGMSKGLLPSYLYQTDEVRIENIKEHVELVYQEGEILGGTMKRDGSSASISVRLNPISTVKEYELSVCSRALEKKLDQKYVSAYKEEGVLLHPFFNKETNIRGWMNDATNTFYTNDEAASKFEPIMTEQKDAWVDTVKKHDYLNKLLEYCKTNNVQLALRGELIGEGNKGSGNKLNADAKSGPSKIVWFGVDDLSSGHATRIHYGQKHNLKEVCEALGFEYTEELFEGKFTYDELIKKCNEYFEKVKTETGRIVEGIVIRSKYSNRLSCKFINGEYDSKS